MSTAFIRVRGAREHNLQGVDLDVPKERLVVFCGVSGSGKSSMAFDTLFAEGQRRYVESLSAYARQFLGQMEKPRYDSISGLTPTIAVAQHAIARNPRSTVGTMTEVHDHLRVLFARAGVQHCHRCGRTVGRQSAAEITKALGGLGEGTRLELLAPVVRDQKGSHKETLDEIRRAGFTRLRIDGAPAKLEDLEPLDARRPHTIEVVVDRLRLRDGAGERLAESVETTLRAGKGVMLAVVDGAEERILSEHLACHHCGISFPDLSPTAFSFNSPRGMCPACQGLGTLDEMDPDLVVPDPRLSIRGGAVSPWKALTRDGSWTARMVAALARQYAFDLDRPWAELPEEARRIVLYGTAGRRIGVEWKGARGEGRFDVDWEGVIPAMMRRMRETKSDAQRQAYLDLMSHRVCRECGGGRLRPESASVRVGGQTIVSLSRMAVSEALRVVRALELSPHQARIAGELVQEIGRRLKFLQDVGLGYLALDRGGSTLSGGEAQRIRLASQLGGELTGVTYVLDEPSIGLHQRDTGRLVATLQRLRDAGNTVIVVEHDRDTIHAADHVVEFGPGAGRSGGHVVFDGTVDGLLAALTLTGEYLSGRRAITARTAPRPPGQRALTIRGARAHNLRGIDVRVPLGLFVVVTGVSGAGKSSLVSSILSPALHNALHGARREVGPHDAIDGLEHLQKIVDVDQSPIGRSPRSNPATYTKAFDLVREVFASTREARVRGYTASRFSFNSKGGRCEACSGDGWLRVEMHFLADVFVPCEICGGRRFDEQTLQVRYKGHDIAQVLDMTVDEALGVFAHHKRIRRILDTLSQVGLGYLRLGQPSNTLSGGEAQRIKLSRELARESGAETIYVLDEPTTGLHFDDIDKLLSILDRLVDGGSTVLVVEHDLDVIKHADWVIDLGPDGGDGGGRLVAAGPPREVARAPGSHTGKYLLETLS